MHDHVSTQQSTRHSRPALRRIALVSGVVLVTLATITWTLHVRLTSQYPPIPLPSLTDFRFDSYEFGVVFQEIMIPLALVSLLSGTDGFRRIVIGASTARDKLVLFGALTLIQVVIISFSFFTEEMSAFGVLAVVVGSLLGGWRMGLAIGLVTMLITGTVDILVWPDELLLARYDAQGLPGVLDPVLLASLFSWRYLRDLGASSAVWAGLVSGMVADLLEERRFAPLAGFLLGAGVCLGVISFAAISWENPLVLTMFLIPGGLVAGLGVAAFGLVVNRVQSGIMRRKAAAAELARARAEVRALRAQINPHFLFNALNTIRYFVRTDPPAARRLLLDLSVVFQHALRSGDFVPLREEIEYVKAYLTLEQMRLEERLQVEWDLENNRWLDHPVPTLILQPIVENAIIHGIAKQPGGGKVSITIRQTADELVLQVKDDGPGIAPERLAEVLGPSEAQQPTSIGLRNVDGRLRALYGEDHGLRVNPESGRGALVEIRIPIEG